jgi:hypothetical protein
VPVPVPTRSEQKETLPMRLRNTLAAAVGGRASDRLKLRSVVFS